MEQIPQLDFSPLIANPSPKQFSAEQIKQLKTQTKFMQSLIFKSGTFYIIVLLLLFIFIPSLALIVMPETQLVTRLIASFVIIFAIIAAFIVYKALGRNFFTVAAQRYLFAQTNQLPYLPLCDTRTFPGLLFKISDTGQLANLISLNDTTKIANYYWIEGYRANAHKLGISFIQFQLPRNYPHVIINSNRNSDDISGISIFNRVRDSNIFGTQVKPIELEGNFGSFFKVYTPDETQIDVRELLTPDIMSIMMDVGTVYNFELIDNYLYVYGQADLFKQPATFTTFLKNTTTIFNTLGNNLSRYQDSRANDAASNIAPADQRIDITAKQKTTNRVAGIVLIAIASFSLIWMIIQIIIERIP
ncbi:hypothetical protein FWF48_02620 [Candidatus Saccharibacteria bacterium]|nr:hypothetical protein [Candidatus Saccharibacteria bacterium]